MSKSLSHHGKVKEPGKFGLDVEELPPWQDGQIDLRAWFDEPIRGHPLELEIGSGKGTFLVQQAPQTPGTNYIGIEYARAFWLHAADRMRRHDLVNVRMLHAEAAFFIRNYVPNGVFHQVHIYFPDPWPKARHNKRRLVQAPFLMELFRVLESTGQIRLATDHEDYFHWMEEHAAMVADHVQRLDFESPASAGEGELVGTNFERKYRREGRPFFGMILRKKV